MLDTRTRPTRSIEDIQAHLDTIDNMMGFAKEGSPAYIETAERRAIVAAELEAAKAYDAAGTKFRSVQMLWVFDRKHGSLFDRGSSDSYYGRARDPHYGGVGGSSGPRVEVTDPVMVAEYLAGYEWNEANGDRKDWGFDF